MTTATYHTLGRNEMELKEISQFIQDFLRQDCLKVNI